MSHTPSKLQAALAACTPKKTPSKLHQASHANGSSVKSAKKKTQQQTPAATTEEDDDADVDADIPQPRKSKSAKKQSRTAPSTDAFDAGEDDADGEITLFHPSTSVVAATSTIAQSASNGADDEDNEEDHANGDASDLTSSSFLSNLLQSESSELLRILRDIESKCTELRKQTIRPMLREVREKQLPTDEGMSFLELKSHLMLQYLQHLVFFVLTKLHGGDSTRQRERITAVTKQLVYLRTVLEKLKPLDKKLRYQVEKMVKLANHMNRSAIDGDDTEAEQQQQQSLQLGDLDHPMEDIAPSMPSLAGADPLSFRPNPAALLATTEDAARANMDVDGGAEEKAGIYRPPRTTSTQLDDHEKAADRKSKALARARDRARTSEFMQFTRNELSSRPQESHIDVEHREDEQERERTEFEERNLLRLTDTRKDKAAKKSKQRAAANSLAGLDGDDSFRDMERVAKELGRGEREGEWMSPDRMDQLQREATGRKRGSRDLDSSAGFDDPAESRHAKRRKGPNGKNPYGAKFKSKGGGSGGKGRGGKRK